MWLALIETQFRSDIQQALRRESIRGLQQDFQALEIRKHDILSAVLIHIKEEIEFV